jgi:hypothetical protein
MKWSDYTLGWMKSDFLLDCIEYRKNYNFLREDRIHPNGNISVCYRRKGNNLEKKMEITCITLNLRAYNKIIIIMSGLAQPLCHTSYFAKILFFLISNIFFQDSNNIKALFQETCVKKT